MHNFAANLMVGLLCEVITLFIISIFHTVEKKNIIELGYQEKNKQRKSIKHKLPLWNALLYWDLCKNAKYNKKAVWVYFFCNLIVCLCAVISFFLSGIIIYICKTRDVWFYLLGYAVLVIYIWAIPHFVLDLFFLPSVRKRYNMKSK